MPNCRLLSKTVQKKSTAWNLSWRPTMPPMRQHSGSWKISERLPNSSCAAWKRWRRHSRVLWLPRARRQNQPRLHRPLLRNPPTLRPPEPQSVSGLTLWLKRTTSMLRNATWPCLTMPPQWLNPTDLQASQRTQTSTCDALLRIGLGRLIWCDVRSAQF